METKTGTMSIYTLSRKDAIENVKNYLESLGMLNIKILYAYPFQDNDKGYTVKYSCQKPDLVDLKKDYENYFQKVSENKESIHIGYFFYNGLPSLDKLNETIKKCTLEKIDNIFLIDKIIAADYDCILIDINDYSGDGLNSEINYVISNLLKETNKRLTIVFSHKATPENRRLFSWNYEVHITSSYLEKYYHETYNTQNIGKLELLDLLTYKHSSFLENDNSLKKDRFHKRRNKIFNRH